MRGEQALAEQLEGVHRSGPPPSAWSRRAVRAVRPAGESCRPLAKMNQTTKEKTMPIGTVIQSGPRAKAPGGRREQQAGGDARSRASSWSASARPDRRRSRPSGRTSCVSRSGKSPRQRLDGRQTPSPRSTGRDDVGNGLRTDRRVARDAAASARCCQAMAMPASTSNAAMTSAARSGRRRRIGCRPSAHCTRPMSFRIAAVASVSFLSCSAKASPAR